MKMICDVPNEVIKSVRMGTWCGSSVAEKMIANGIPLEQIRAEIEQKIVKRPWLDFKDRERDRNDAFLEVLDIIDKYRADKE